MTTVGGLEADTLAGGLGRPAPRVAGADGAAG
jgi:hypothetical protein